jgi:hypothetical protein
MRKFAYVLAAGAGLFLTACEHYGDVKEGRKTVPVNAAVTIAEDGAGGYIFNYQAPFADEKGNFDFSRPGALYNTIRLTFTIADGSIPGVAFKTDATDAMWIVEKVNVDKETGSPRGPYRGNQFYGFQVSKDGRELTVTNTNDDGVLYRYGLRFDLGGKMVVDDPDVGNGGPH